MRPEKKQSFTLDGYEFRYLRPTPDSRGTYSVLYLPWTWRDVIVVDVTEDIPVRPVKKNGARGKVSTPPKPKARTADTDP